MADIMNMELCYSTTCFGPENTSGDLTNWLKIIKSSGTDYVEISRKHHEITKRKSLIKATGIKVWSIHGTLDFEALDDNEQIRTKAIKKEIARMADTACFAPCPYVIHYLDRFNSPIYGLYFREAIEQLIEANKEFGFILAIETAPYKPLENERYPDSREIAKFVRSFDDDSLKMTIDINHSNLNENTFEVCQNCKGLIANIHVSDNHGEYEEHLIPGEGIIPLQEVMQEMQKNGYQGPCNLELHFAEPPAYQTIASCSQNVSAQLKI